MHDLNYNKIAVSGSLADGKKRKPQQHKHETCTKGWDGLLCNGQSDPYTVRQKTYYLVFITVCQSDDACVPLVDPDNLRSPPNRTLMAFTNGAGSILPLGEGDGTGTPDHTANGAVCYTGGRLVNEIHEMCDVTSPCLRSSQSSLPELTRKSRHRPQDSRYAAQTSTTGHFLM